MSFPFAAEDAAVVAAARDVKVLTELAWPVEVGRRFLAGWRAGNPALPEPPRVEFQAEAEALERLSTPAGDHPMARFIARTAASYRTALGLLENAHTPRFTALSRELYGGPRDRVLPGGLTSLEAARHFVAETDSLASSCPEVEGDYRIPAETVQARIQAAIDPVFHEEPLAVVLDPGLAAKAAAGATRIRLRAGASFSEADVAQLIQHEALVHSATSRNGRAQPYLTCLSLGAPRTTATQEGLASFAELISNAIDLARLRRIALRIVAIDHALEGADFIEVFRYFLDTGSPPREAYASAQRVFRGGDVRGGVAFTKDVVYLRGLLRTHAWLHAALSARKLMYPHYLFAGRLTWNDVEELEPCFEEGLIAPPRFEPAWVKNRTELAAWLAFSNLTHSLPVAEAELADFATVRLKKLRRIEREEEA